MKNVFKNISSFIVIGILILSNEALSQCTVDVGPPTITINCGESLDLSAMGSGSVPVLSTNFDNGQAGPGWVSAGGTQFSQPCGAGVNGTPYYWASTAGSGTPALTTVGFDVSCGAVITFDMVYSAQGGAAPCEGPDLPDEGVTFEYSTDGGVTWIPIQYWDPNGGNDPMLTNWNNYTITIPAGAWGPNTMFQWIQYNSSGTCCDNWGIDNVLITPGLCGGGWNYDWSNIPGSNDPTQQTVTPMVDTQYSVILTNGTEFCYDTVDVIVNPLIADATTTAAVLTCPNCADLDAVFTNNSAGSIIDDFNPVEDGSMWSNIQNGVAGTGCTSMSGNAMHFNGSGQRSIETVAINATVCGMANFCLYMGNSGSGGAPCENADAGENVVFEYSIDAGINWTIITTYDHSLWDNNNNWQCFFAPLPPPAQTTSTMFRWRQLSNSGNNMDNWALDDVNIACTPPAFNYVWTPAIGLSDALIQAPQACPLVPTTYSVTITDPATGCSATDDVYIDITCTCTITQTTAQVSQCENGNTFTVSGDFLYVENPVTGTLVVEVTNASGTYTQTFNPPFVDLVVNNYSISGIIADGSPLTVDFYFTDDPTCTAQIADVSPVLPTLSNVTGGAIYCPGDVMTDITVDVTGNGPFTVDFTLDGVAQNVAGAGPTISLGNAVGNYVITAVNDLGCTNTASGNETISLQPLPTVISMTGGDSYCDNDPIDDIVLDLSGTGPWIVNYTIDGVSQSITSAVSPMNLGTTEGVYQLVDIADANCFDVANDVDEIIIEPAPTVFAGADFINCENDPIVLSGSGAASYTWDNNVTNGVPFIPTATTTYTVTGTDANGCQDTDAITVIFEALPDVQFVADTLIGCEPFPVVFTNTTPGSMVLCEWDFGDGNTGVGCNSIENVYQYGGYYDVMLTTTSSNGCVNSTTYSDYIYVENVPQPGFIASSQQVLSLDTEVHFDNISTGAVNYVWDFGDNSALSYDENPLHEFPGDQTTGYIVTLYAYSPIGCVDSTTTVIQVNEEVIFYLPNTFTPDGDEFNQDFQPVFTAGYDPYDFDMYIFNRWGEIVWESHDASVAWDGTYNGRPVQEGTYTWKIEFKTIATDERMTVNGHVNLIR